MRLVSVLFVVFTMIISNMQAVIAEEAVKKNACIEEKIIGYGFPNRVQSVANMNAVIQWMTAVKKKHGDSYAQWHTAKESKVDCRQAGRDLHICNAYGQPCQQANSVKPDKKG